MTELDPLSRTTGEGVLASGGVRVSQPSFGQTSADAIWAHFCADHRVDDQSFDAPYRYARPIKHDAFAPLRWKPALGPPVETCEGKWMRRLLLEARMLPQCPLPAQCVLP